MKEAGTRSNRRERRRQRRPVVYNPLPSGAEPKCRCCGLRWPVHYTGLVRVTPRGEPEVVGRISYECHVEGNTPDVDDPDRVPSYLVLVIPPKKGTPTRIILGNPPRPWVSSDDAKAAGLRKRRKRSSPLPPANRLREMIQASDLERSETIEKLAGFYGVTVERLERRITPHQAVVMRGECANPDCKRLKPSDRNYCFSCEALILRELRANEPSAMETSSQRL